MHWLIAPDSFKDAASAADLAKAFAEGVLQAAPEDRCTLLPLADGGEGTARIMINNLGGEMVRCQTLDPLGRPMEAAYGLANDGTAIIELAAASGIQLLRPHERNPLLTSTFGTGLLVKEALQKGAKKIVLTLGSSATNDGGCGLAAALGYRFLANGKPVEIPRGEDLLNITSIDDRDVMPQISGRKTTGDSSQSAEKNTGISFTVLCDVNNPFYGQNGAAHTYAPQKGADAAAVEKLDLGLQNIARLIQSKYQLNLQEIPGAGAAGGCGGGAVAFLNARMQRGISAVMEWCDFENRVRTADIIVTGEGSIDAQTFTGKVVKGVCEIAAKHQKPVIAFCGINQLGFTEIRELGLEGVFPISNGAKPLELALKDTLADTTRLGASIAGLKSALSSRL